MIVTKDNPTAVKEARRKMQRVLNPKLGEVVITYQGKEIKGIVETTPSSPAAKEQRYLLSKYLIHLLCHKPFGLTPIMKAGDVLSYGWLQFKLSLPTGFSSRGLDERQLMRVMWLHRWRLNLLAAINPTVTNLTTGN